MKPDETPSFVPGITVETIAARMRALIGQNQQQEVISDTHDLDCSGIRSAITAAEARANVGTQVTPMYSIPAPLRGLARLAGKAVIKLASFITVEQRSFNRHVLDALGLFADSAEQTNHALRRGFRRGTEADRQATTREALDRLTDWYLAMDHKLALQQEILDDLARMRTSMLLLEERITILLEQAGKDTSDPVDQERAQETTANDEIV